MKLIDIDKLVSDYKAKNKGLQNVTWFELTDYEVKAIPIEWIKCWVDKFFEDINGTRYYMGDGYDTVWDMLEDWGKENENIKESD